MNQKATMTIKLNEVFKTNFSIFDDYEDIVKKEQIKTLNYIATISTELEKNLDNVNLMDILPNNNNIILADNAQINDILINFDRAKYFDKPEIIETELLNEENIETINALYKSNFTQQKRDFERNIENNISEAQHRMRDYYTYMEKVSNIKQKIKDLVVADNSEIIGKLNTILEDKRFKFLGFKGYSHNNDTIVLEITDDIICSEKNERAEIDLRVNLGRMKLELKYYNGIRIQAKMHKDNIRANGYYHPHLDSSGNACLGNMTELFNEAAENADLHKICDIIYNILFSYNGDVGGPYAPLIKFAQASKQVQPDGEIKTEENSSPSSTDERYQIHNCHECESEYEVEFSCEDDSDYAEFDCDECGEFNEVEFDYDR